MKFLATSAVALAMIEGSCGFSSVLHPAIANISTSTHLGASKNNMWAPVAGAIVGLSLASQVAFGNVPEMPIMDATITTTTTSKNSNSKSNSKAKKSQYSIPPSDAKRSADSAEKANMIGQQANLLAERNAETSNTIGQQANLLAERNALVPIGIFVGSVTYMETSAETERKYQLEREVLELEMKSVKSPKKKLELLKDFQASTRPTLLTRLQRLLHQFKPKGNK